MSNPWTDDTVDELRRLHKSGLSCSQIAGRLGKGLTRNAVIGKLHRLGLQAKGGATAKQRSLRARQTRLRAMAKADGRTLLGPARIGSKRKTVQALQADGWKPAPETQPATLHSIADWPSDNCQWPYGGDREPVKFGCCGAKVPGLPYCLDHIKRAYRPPEPSRSNSGVTTPADTQMPASDQMRGFNVHSMVEAGE